MRGLGDPPDSSLAAEGGVEDGADERCGILYRFEAVGNMGKLVGERSTLHERRPQGGFSCAQVCLALSFVELTNQIDLTNETDQTDQTNQLSAARHERLLRAICLQRCSFR